jgi:hypothetical protein
VPDAVAELGSFGGEESAVDGAVEQVE